MTESRSYRKAACLVLACAFASGCATAASSGPKFDIVWPGKPDKPRIRYVRTLRGLEDLPAKGLVERLKRALVGTNASLALFNPTTVCLSPDDRVLYVSLTGSGRVLAIDLESNNIRHATSSGDKDPRHPFGIATDGAGNLYVADEVAGVVLVYSTNGKFLREIGKDALKRPTGLAIDRKGQILYVSEGGRVDNMDHRIEAFSLEGTHIRTIGSRGSSLGEFNFPTYMAVSPEGLLYVSDSLNFRIQIFDAEGRLMGYFGQAGAGVGAFNKLKGLAFDNAGFLHVVDAGNSIVQIFNQKQQLMLVYGGLGAPDPFMRTPGGIAIDSKNNIFVADLVANHVNQYVLLDTSDEGEGAPPPAASSPGAPPPSAP